MPERSSIQGALALALALALDLAPMWRALVVLGLLGTTHVAAAQPRWSALSYQAG